MNVRAFFFVLILSAFFLSACNHSKPKPVSNDISKTTVSVNGKKDSVINNPERNYTNATVSEICVKCLLKIIQQTDSYKKLSTSLQPKNVLYGVNWITSKTPAYIGNGNKIVNGMAIAINQKIANGSHTIATYLYNNENARVYLQSGKNNTDVGITVADSSLKTIRRSCFWDVASSK